MSIDARSDTDLVLAARGQNSDAFNTLFERWFPKAWNVARNILRDDDLAADVAQDAVLAAWQRLDELNNPDAFGGWLLRISRNRALNKLDRERRSRTTGDETVSELRDQGAFDPTAADRLPEPDQISDARDRQELVWAAAAALGERDASLLDLHLRHGLSPSEIADELGVSANTAHQQLFRLRSKLGDAVGSYLLWRHGRPLCDHLAAAVSGSVAFDQSVARAVARHQKTCEVCAEQRKGLVSPVKLFSSVPLAVMPLQLQTRAAAALAEAGVPIQIPSGEATHAEPPQEPTASEPIPTEAAKPETAATDRLTTVSSEGIGRLPLLAGAGVATLAAVAVGVLLVFSGGDDNLNVEADLAAEIDSAADVADGDTSVPDSGADQPNNSAAQTSESTSNEGGATLLDPDELIGPPPPPAGPAADQTNSSLITPTSSGPSIGSTSGGGDDKTSSTSSTPGMPSPQPSAPNSPSTEQTTATTRPTTVTTPSTKPTTPSTVSTTGTRPTPPSTTSTTATTESTTTTETTRSEPEPPTIDRFLIRSSPGSGECKQQHGYVAAWVTSNTESVLLTVASGSFDGEPIGQQFFCGPRSGSATLLATGPGGRDKATASLG